MQLSGVKVLQSMSFLSASPLARSRSSFFRALGLLNDDDKNDGIFRPEQQQQHSSCPLSPFSQLLVLPFPLLFAGPTIHKRTNCLKINFVGRRRLLLYQVFFRLVSCRFSCIGFSSLCGFVKAFASSFISIGILALA